MIPLPAMTAVAGRTFAMRAGNDSNELAKMTGITPDWFTFSGM